MFCDLIQREDGRWICPACDPDGKLTLPRKMLRNCQARPAVFDMKDYLRGRLLDKHALGLVAMPLAEAVERAERCFGRPCFLDGCTLHRATCDRAERWLTFISGIPKLETCDKWSKPNGK